MNEKESQNEIVNNTVDNTDKDRCYTVYMHTSPSEKRYIGAIKQTPEKKWLSGREYIGN